MSANPATRLRQRTAVRSARQTVSHRPELALPTRSDPHRREAARPGPDTAVVRDQQKALIARFATSEVAEDLQHQSGFPLHWVAERLASSLD